MGWTDLAQRRAELTKQMSIIHEVTLKILQGDISSLDANQDGNNEINRIYSDNGATIFENFDLDSNGAIDYTRYFDENGEVFSEFFYSNNPENNEVLEPKNDWFNKTLNFLGLSKESQIISQADALAQSLTENEK